jgi:predicted small integral membrane protein
MLTLDSTRLVQIMITLLAGCYLLLVGINNILDYDVNFEFTKQVMGMHTLFESNDLDNGRRISQIWLVHIFYNSIITVEISSGLLTLKGGWHLVRYRKSEPAIFNEQKRLAISGVLLGLVLWTGGFLIIAGEWFQMWQSEVWNAQGTAFNLAILYGVFILILLKE